MTDEFVVVWTVPSEGIEEDCWLMVKHKNRGWEFPGGAVNDGEGADIAALRELYEEAGLLGVAKALDFSLIEGGCVALVEVSQSPSPISWKSEDESIEEVGWCLEIPEDTAWGIDEIERVRNHDWSTSIILGS
ncbi:MAG: NUDIX domain-containing protein [Candidatus Thalassarchaeaceae archaeon]|nr:NUDIX domain-containing protein [Candidatus Thalassarchaeaceae archaeon]MEE2629365.1 NUDIX domain-containing protein [Candidatus Thermoplasmatota archaeon]